MVFQGNKASDLSFGRGWWAWLQSPTKAFFTPQSFTFEMAKMVNYMLYEFSHN